MVRVPAAVAASQGCPRLHTHTHPPSLLPSPLCPGRSPLHYAYLERYAKRNLHTALDQLKELWDPKSANNLTGRPAGADCAWACCVAINQLNMTQFKTVRRLMARSIRHLSQQF